MQFNRGAILNHDAREGYPSDGKEWHMARLARGIRNIDRMVDDIWLTVSKIAEVHNSSFRDWAVQADPDAFVVLGNWQVGVYPLIVGKKPGTWFLRLGNDMSEHLWDSGVGFMKPALSDVQRIWENLDNLTDATLEIFGNSTRLMDLLRAADAEMSA